MRSREPDNLEIGRAMAKAVRQELGDELAAKRIGVLCGNQKQLAMQQRLQGLQEGLGVGIRRFCVDA